MTLGQISIPQSRRVELFCDALGAWLGASWKDEGLNDKGARLIEHLLRVQSPEGFFPSMTARHRAFLDSCVSHAGGYGLRTPQRRVAYVGAALIHGMYWFDDPLLRRLRIIFETSETNDLLLSQMADFYSGFA